MTPLDKLKAARHAVYRAPGVNDSILHLICAVDEVLSNPPRERTKAEDVWLRMARAFVDFKWESLREESFREAAKAVVAEADARDARLRTLGDVIDDIEREGPSPTEEGWSRFNALMIEARSRLVDESEKKSDA